MIKCDAAASEVCNLIVCAIFFDSGGDVERTFLCGYLKKLASVAFQMVHLFRFQEASSHILILIYNFA